MDPDLTLEQDHYEQGIDEMPTKPDTIYQDDDYDY